MANGTAQRREKFVAMRSVNGFYWLHRTYELELKIIREWMEIEYLGQHSSAQSLTDGGIIHKLESTRRNNAIRYVPAETSVNCV